MIDVGAVAHRSASAVSGVRDHRSATIIRPVVLLVVALGVRVVLERSPATAGFVAGATFGGLLIAGCVVAGGRLGRPALMGLFLGLVGATMLIVLPRLLHPDAPSLVGMRPEPYLLWVAITFAVAVSEEWLIRGVLFDALELRSGTVIAVALTSVVFALMHVPLYGWNVVPIDLAAGVWLAGLRLTSGGITAPAIAHVIADLATW